MEGNTKFQSEVSENNNVFFSPFKFTDRPQFYPRATYTIVNQLAHTSSLVN